MDEAERRAAQNEARRRKRKSRGRGLRKTTGCITCKRRHLRCDEATPTCGNCGKSKQTCIYAESRPQAFNSDNDNGSSTTNTNDESAIETCPSSHPQASEVSSLELVVDPYCAAELIPSSLTTTNTNQSSLSDPSNNSFHPVSTPPDAAFFRWFGLLADDAAAAAADEHVTAFLNSQAVSNGLSWETYREGQAVPNAPVPCVSEPPPAETLSRDAWLGARPADLSTRELDLFDNFVKRVSSWIDLHDPSRCFSILVPHLAMRDAGLMTAILALSSRQLSINPSANDQERDRSIGLQYYYDTLRYLQQAMSIVAYTTSLELLATAVIVSMYEMLDDSGSGSGWERHLKGVFWIQRSQVIHGETGGLRSAVWWAWLRQDVWAAFRERRKTLSFWKPTKAYSAMDSYEKAARIVWIFAKAVDYCSNEEVAAGEDEVRMRRERADAIFDMLNEWEKNVPLEFAPMPGTTKAGISDCFDPLWIHPSAFAVSIQLFHSAQILVLLHKPSLGSIRGYAEQQRLIGLAATTICRIAMTITEAASSLMSSQCLYIAGLSIQVPEQREQIVRLLDDCHQRTGWPHHSLSSHLREEWSKLDAT